MGTPSPQALTFDVFGTTVDWHRSVAKEAARIGTRAGIEADWPALTNSWRGKYRPFMDRVRNGALPWMKFDALHLLSLEEVLDEFAIDGFSEADKAELNSSWQRLDPWPDTVAGLGRLRARYIVAALSNGNLGLLTRMAKHAGLPWDCILSAEMAHAYKPDPAVYALAADLLDVEPSEILMVAAHDYDLDAARSSGMGTAYVRRPREFGDAGKPEPQRLEGYDLVVGSFEELADALGA
ncbi:MAG: haloacid dehalogenase type II [Actinomycetota bacterium]